MIYVLKVGVEFVAIRGCYTKRLSNARMFPTHEAAEKARCGIERVVQIIEQETDNRELAKALDEAAKGSFGETGPSNDTGVSQRAKRLQRY